ncbi:MAG: insulinase family protein [Clostridia bacterium]|nr:insulinase family protein [Clostridia bacterium]
MNSTLTASLTPSITLHYTQTTRFKTARLSLFAVMPADERRSPLSTLLFGILRRGSEGYPSLSQLNRRLDELYGTTLTIRNYLHGDSHVVSYTAEMLESRFLPPHHGDLNLLGGVTELLADMILHPLRDPDGGLRAEAVEKEKQSLTDSLRALRNDTRAYAATRLREIMCDGEPYGISIGGTVDGVAAITPRDVTEHYEALMHELRLEVFYTGQASFHEVKAVWERAFGHWNPAPGRMLATTRHLVPPSPRVEQEDMAVSQGKLCLAWSCGQSFSVIKDPRELAAYAVCNEVFGVMQNSLLFRYVREELGLCYYCDSALDMTKGILWVSCGIHSDRRNEAEAAIRAQLATLQEGKITSEDVELAKLSLLNSYRQMEDSQNSMEAFSFGRLMNGTRETPEEEMACVRAVTVEDISRVARSFAPDTVFFLRGTLANDDGEEEIVDD